MIKFGAGVAEDLKKIAGEKATHKGEWRDGKTVKLGDNSIKLGGKPPVGPASSFDPDEVC